MKRSFAAILRFSFLLTLLFILSPCHVWAQLADSPWPMFHHDVRHTGLSPYSGPSQGALSWSYVTGDEVRSSPAVGSDGALYVGSFDNRFYSLASTGALSWSYLTSNDLFSSPTVGKGETVYVGSGDGRLYSLSSTGTLSWTYVTGSLVYSSPTIGSDEMIYVGSIDNRLYGLTSTGTLSWSYLTGDYITSSPAIGSNETVCVGSSDNRLYSLTSTGALSWSFMTGDEFACSPAIGSDGTVYVGSIDSRIYSLTSVGTLLWSYKTGDWVASSSAIGSDGALYVGSEDNRLYSLTSTGTLSWSYVTGDEVRSSPAIGSDGALYVGSFDNRFYSLTSTGALLWSYVTGDDVYSSPAIGSDETVYVGSYDDRLYVFEELQPTATPTITSTPTNTPTSTPTNTPTGTPTDTPTNTPTGTPTSTPTGTNTPTLTPTGTPTTIPKLALLVSQNLGDLNIYFWNSLVEGDWTYWDCYSRNPSPLARDLWQIPTGNDAVGMTSIDISEPQDYKDDLALLVSQDLGDLNIYFWNAPVTGDWTYWDCFSRNPSPLARDLWQIPTGNDAVDMASIDINAAGKDELAMLVSENVGDLNIYFWNAPEDGDWTYWDANARNPSPLARDLWQIPIGNTAVGMTNIDITDDGKEELALLVQQNVGDLNIYFWNSLVSGDWTYWDCYSRNPSPLARDLWQIPIGNDAVGITSVDHDGDGKKELGVLVSQNVGDLNIYFWNAPVAGDWTYWDCYSRNPSPLARDLWQIPIGNDAVGLTDIDIQ